MEINHSIKENWKLKSGRIIITSLLVLVFFSLNAQVNINKESTSIETVKGDLLLTYVKKCPGEISGECNRSVFLLSNNNHKAKDFKKGEYQLQNNEIYVIFELLYIKKFLSNVKFTKEKTLNELLKFFTREKNLWKYKFEDFKTTKKGKVKLKILSDVDNSALLIKVDNSFLNEIYDNRIVVKSSNKEVKVAILFENESLLELERIMGFIQ